MSWDYNVSHDRVEKHLDSMGDIEVKPMVREIDLAGLSETRCRDIFGAHVYAEIRNLSALVSKRTTKAERQELIQATHLYQREVARIAVAVGAERIHFQGGRAHLLIHHPIGDVAEIATKAVLLQIVLDRFGVVFNTEFDDIDDVYIHSGADMGQAIGTRNGTGGDRELLFLGAPANHAAKLIDPAAPRRMTKAIADAVDDDLAALLTEESNDPDTFRLARPTVTELADLLETYGVDWSPEASAERLSADREQFPADEAGLWGSDVLIDFDTLSYSNSKLVAAATLYGDVSGFTAYIDAARTEDEQREALRAFHAIRKEMARVVKDDFHGVRVQFQGDRVQGLFSLPSDDADGISDEAVHAAVGLQSSFEKVLKALLPDIASLGLAVGVSRGETIAARLGERAHRDRICLGEDVLRAESNEERSDKTEIGISGNVRDHLSRDLAKHFAWDASKNCYVAKGLYQDRLDLDEGAQALDAGGPAFIKAAAGVTVISTASGMGRAVRPSSSYGPSR
jgi:hypothetical protein